MKAGQFRNSGLYMMLLFFWKFLISSITIYIDLNCEIGTETDYILVYKNKGHKLKYHVTTNNG